MSDLLQTAAWSQKITEAIQSKTYIEVRRRIFRQLVESLIYEGILRTRSHLRSGHLLEFEFQGQTETGKPVTYVCQGEKKVSFGRIRLLTPIFQKDGEAQAEVTDFAAFLSEVSISLTEPPVRLREMIDELNQTLIKDTMAQVERFHRSRSFEHIPDELEGEMMDAHPYHPCYKSRIGFDLVDNNHFGPEFHPDVRLFWVAIKREWTLISESKQQSYENLIQAELSTEELARFEQTLLGQNLNPQSYVFVPVHPWQWREEVLPRFFTLIREQVLIPLGETMDVYRPQQSIRTLANLSDPHKSYVKVPISIINTSARRILGSHHVENAAPVSDWLQEIVNKDAVLKEEYQTIFLKEQVAICFDVTELPSALQPSCYGVLGAIWRESLHCFLKQGEESIPYTALCHTGKDGRPFIDPWIKKYGLKDWVKQVLKASIEPMIHLMYAHGIGLESHAQNMILLHRQGKPTRIALRDLPGGLRYHTGDEWRERGEPDFQKSSQLHSNQVSSMETDKAYQVRDFLVDAFFHINLAEWAMFLERHYPFSEAEFWSLAGKIIVDYQKRYSHLSERFALFDLFAEEVEVGQLTVRRLCGDAEYRDHIVKNPLFLYKGSSDACSN